MKLGDLKKLAHNHTANNWQSHSNTWKKCFSSENDVGGWTCRATAGATELTKALMLLSNIFLTTLDSFQTTASKEKF